MAQTAEDGRNVGKPLSQLKSAADLCKKTEQLKRMRAPLERQWRLNLRFYKGDQYSYYPPKSDRLERLAVDDAAKPTHRVRLVSNQIMPGAHAFLAQLTKTKPKMQATPGSGSDHDLRAAQMAQSLLEYLWHDLALDEKLDEALLWSIISSAGFWKITWDPYAAKQMRFMLGPDGQPITDEGLKTAFKAELDKIGLPPQEKVVYMGDIRIDVMSPFDVFLDPNAKTFEDCKFAICKHALDPDEIRTRWGATVTPNATPGQPDETYPFGNSPDAAEKSVRNVFIGYFKPTAAMPDGRYVVWVDGNDKQILADEKWPYPTNDLPLVKFAGFRVPGSVYDDAPVTHAIPLQKELNRTISQIVEYKNMTINPVMTAPVGSLRTRRTTEPGQVLEYAPFGTSNLKPEFEQLPTLPPYVFEHLADISARLKDIFLSAEVVEGKVPPNVEAGVAIDLLQEMATDKLAPIVKLLEVSLGRAGQQILALAQKNYIEPRLMKIRGSGGSVQVKQFVNADIAGDVSVRVDTGSGLPRTRAGRQARIEMLLQNQLISPAQAIKELDVADLDGVTARLTAQEDLAYRNIDKLLEGVPINPEAVQQAMMSVNQGINPDTQQPIQSAEEAQQILHDAGLKPMVGIDWDTHMEVLSLYMAGVEFDGLPSPIRQDFITAYSNLLDAKLSAPIMPEPQSIRTTYQIKGTAGPTASSKILEKSGVQVSPEDMAEPPLETWVTDSVDKPDTDQGAPGEEAANLSDAAKTLIEAQAAKAEAQQTQAQSSVTHAADMAQRAQQMQHADEAHQQKLSHNEQTQMEKLRQMRKPKPAPNGNGS